MSKAAKPRCAHCAGKMGKSHEFCPHCGKRALGVTKSESAPLVLKQQNVTFDLSSPDPNEREMAYKAAFNRISSQASTYMDPLSEPDPRYREAIWAYQNKALIEKADGGNW